MSDLLAQCRWPELGAPYDAALRAAVEFLLAEFEPLGIIASGTIIRGTPDANSDFDMYLIGRQPFRQRLQMWFQGVPAELFINTPATVRQYLAQEHKSRRPITAHMLATGFVILEHDPVIGQLRQEARDSLAAPPPVNEQESIWARYTAATLIEDALDLRAKDPAAAAMILGQAVAAIVDYLFIVTGRFLPRHKERLTALAAWSPQVGAQVRAFYEARDHETRFNHALALADSVLETRGFFAWDSPPDPQSLASP